MGKRILIGIILLLLLVTCNKPGISDDVKKIYDSRVELIEKFEGVTIWSRGDSSFSLNIYYGGKSNRYSFKRDNGLQFQSDTVQFPLSEISRFKSIDSSKQNQRVKDYFAELLNRLDALGIKEVSSERMAAGINLEFFLRTGGVVFFVRQLAAVNNPIWLNYINESKLVGESWYYNKKG